MLMTDSMTVLTDVLTIPLTVLTDVLTTLLTDDDWFAY